MRFRAFLVPLVCANLAYWWAGWKGFVILSISPFPYVLYERLLHS